MTHGAFRLTYWSDARPAESATPLIGRDRADVVVIGAGIVGLSTALYLCRAGATVAVLESEYAGFGSSGRNFGLLTPVLGPWSGELADRGDQEEARRLMTWTKGCLTEARDALEASGLPCDYRPARVWFVARRESDVPELSRSVERHRRWGLTAYFVTANELPNDGRTDRYGAMVLEDHALVDPWRMTRGFRTLALAAGARLYEGTPAMSVRQVGRGVEVTTPCGDVSADRAVIATNAYSGRLDFMHEYVRPAHSYAISTLPLATEESRSCCEAGDLVLDFTPGRIHAAFYTRLSSSGSVLFGGGGGAPAVSHTELAPDRFEGAFGRLAEELARRYPLMRAAGPSWGGPVCFTPERLPVVAEHHELERVLIVIACNGRGMGVGSSAGRLVAALLDSAHASGSTAEVLRLFGKAPRWPGATYGDAC